MLIKRVSLTNFRNYAHATLDLSAGLNIILGENAQGKTNFLEAIELLANGRSSRTSLESDFIKHTSNQMHIETLFERQKIEESLALSVMRTDPANGRINITDIKGLATFPEGEKSHKRKVYVNGVSYLLLKKLRDRLVVVTFNSNDLYLLRSGPSFRREWLDSVIVRLKPSFYEQMSKYQKIVQQRNRLLKRLAEAGHIFDKDNDQLDVWSEQVAICGAIIIKWRLKILRMILAKVQYYLALISDQNEFLTVVYRCQSLKSESQPSRHRSAHNYYDTRVVDLADITEDLPHISNDSEAIHKVEDQEEQEILENLLYSLNKRKIEEIARGQTLSGPHRDDIIFLLNSNDATAFASQGQQRSLVLALKLSELDLVTDHLLEPPVLLLDDVLAELDPKRQSLLISQIDDTVQTIVSTTHLSGFNSQWLNTARFYEVKSGTIIPVEAEVAINADRANIRESETVR